MAMVAVLTAFAVTAPAQAADLKQPSLHVYSTGKQVRGLTWMLSGHRPSHYRYYVTFHGKPSSVYGKKTRLAVREMKYRLGYPKSLLNGRVAGRYFHALLKGKVARPITWIGIAGQRTHEIEVEKAKKSTCVDEIITAARSVGFGFKEIWGANWGPQVQSFQHVTHNSYHAAWCVSFAQWVNQHAGLGTIADASAGVQYVYYWAQRRGWVHSSPRPGAWVAFGYAHSTHMGIVERVWSNGQGYVSIEGNHAGGVYEVSHTLHDNYPVFLWQPCIVPKVSR